MSIRLRQPLFVISETFPLRSAEYRKMLLIISIGNKEFHSARLYPLVTEGDRRSFMDNKNEITGRNIIISDFEVAPYDPDEYEYAGDQKCHGQLIVNKQEKTITFRHISGTCPIFHVVLAAMSINKNWFRIFDAIECEAKYKDYMLLIRDWPAAYYVAHVGENGLPVVEKQIKNVPYFSEAKELTLNELEFYLLAEFKTMLHFNNGGRKRAQNLFMKVWEFRYIK